MMRYFLQLIESGCTTTLTSFRTMGNGFGEIIAPAPDHSDPEKAFIQSMGTDRGGLIRVTNVKVV